ncbi:MAG: 1-acyl-sn-glycerol-3-phosphate acyltransferase [Deltaproteobacteria bacterium]|jgi:1-acyl-sn-glycerol-3-phosphate acyltransferase|nr:1-acyl-sn-glycerol-3-phosphate acyltransferase [Deltaproteobacteria bacterium]
MNAEALSPYAIPNYKTPPGQAKFFSGAFPALGFYSRLMAIVYSASKLAKQGQYPNEEWVKSSFQTLAALEACGIKINIEGLEQVMDLRGPCVFVSNHMSTLETFGLPCLIQPYRDVTYVVKESLLNYPYFGAVLASRDPIVVTRKDLRADLTAMLDGGCARLAAGRSIIIFPQSTRGVRLDPQHFNSIGVKLARKAGVPVLPIALRTDAWGNGSLIKDFGPLRKELTVHFKFGAPMEINGNGKAEHAAIVDFISRNLANWGLEVDTAEKQALTADSNVPDTSTAPDALVDAPRKEIQ